MQKDDGYQYNFSKHFSHVYIFKNREKKAATINKILEDFYGEELGNATVLSMGASTGIIEKYIAKSCKRVTGIDIDKDAISFAQENFSAENLDFNVKDALNTNYEDSSFDIIICNHVYEHVPDADRLLKEIYRILKENGFCYFTAGNKLTFREPHYNLPFLSVLPKYMADWYMRLTGKGDQYFEKHLTYWGLKRLVKQFCLIDYTKKLTRNPELYAADYLIRKGTLKYHAAHFILKFFYWLCPTYIWILVKTD